MKNKVAFLGAGSHADAILPILDLNNYEFMGYFDDKDIKEHDGYPILGKMHDILHYLESGEVNNVFITIGDNVKRKELFDLVAKEYYHSLINIISPKAIILSPKSIKGRGIFIGIGAFVGSKVEIYDNNVVNTGAVIEHHSIIKSHCNIAPNSTINGLCILNEGVYAGSSCTLVQLIEVSPYTTIGAGTVVIKSLTETGTYVGVPARKLND
ncbi:NeuD/PglB/VioB family sugar acetyltransferase [Streptococcus sp. FSL R7-0212]|uniref:NeuD/PglB/VioB family sugar acetyltransferase n=1 Tax=Streptococcus sp. FSL R7-0212 TaxID=2921726 RepID=UPI0030F4BB8F